MGLTAGLTLASLTIHKDLAYASLAGLSPEMGLYATMTAAFIHILTGVSRQLPVGPASSLCILMAVRLSSLALSPYQYSASATLADRLVGLTAIATYLFRSGVLSKPISSTVLTYWLHGWSAVYIASRQMAHCLEFQAEAAGLQRGY